MTADDHETAEYPRGDEPVRDGIGEEDHDIPLWFNVGFYGLIVAGIVYIIYFQSTGWSAREKYDAEVAAATARSEAHAATQPAHTNNPYAGDAAAIEQGQEVFATICAVCHKPDGSGLVGPSLVDPYWKYGESDAEQFKSVAEGRPLGMPPWLAQLGTEKIWKALAYANSLPRSSEPGVGAPGVGPPGAAAAAGTAPGT